MVREPLQSSEAWMKKAFHDNQYQKVTNRIIGTFVEIDNIIYHRSNSIGVRLEDLKTHPRKTIPTLCDWLGIAEQESLYEMTAQGKKWWGDPASPDYSKEGMDPFGKSAIQRKVGAVFSKTDQFILQTLFYPFSVRFGYVEENPEQFKADLQAVRPMLDQMFDFEKTIAKNTHADEEQFMKSGTYLYFRSCLIDRWNVLNEFGTYPNMMQALKIDFGNVA